MKNDYSRSVTLRCPTCAGDQFSFDDGNDQATCEACGLETTRDALIAENAEAIELAKTEMVSEIKKDIVSDFRKAFRGR